MIKSSLENAWAGDYKREKGALPRVIVGQIVNKSSEHINTESFVKDLESSLINSGKVRFVASSAQRDEIRAERLDQATNARAETVKSMGQETGADFMLKGQINTIVDAISGQKVKYYQVDLEMIDILNNEKVWIGQKKIKKYVAKSKYKA